MRDIKLIFAIKVETVSVYDERLYFR